MLLKVLLLFVLVAVFAVFFAFMVIAIRLRKMDASDETDDESTDSGEADDATVKEERKPLLNGREIDDEDGVGRVEIARVRDDLYLAERNRRGEDICGEPEEGSQLTDPLDGDSGEDGDVYYTDEELEELAYKRNCRLIGALAGAAVGLIIGLCFIYMCQMPNRAKEMLNEVGEVAISEGIDVVSEEESTIHIDSNEAEASVPSEKAPLATTESGEPIPSGPAGPWKVPDSLN